eukprot:TRINITY_DN6083_c0_g1_i1.p1 TRINITY_DN6083_c0_g1~~TRINITY_DN6083_c0_g1_i1.p1  ORF type:complete len:133 (+),score=14.78 TRINITY_DN6083_c0_g1_i1:72-470(+)
MNDVTCFPKATWTGNNHQYQYCEFLPRYSLNSWSFARTYATAQGGYLATTTTAEELRFLADHIRAMEADVNQIEWVWLGGHIPNSLTDINNHNIYWADDALSPERNVLISRAARNWRQQLPVQDHLVWLRER